MVNLENTVKELVNELEVETDFKPIKAKASVSRLVKEMKNKR